MSGKFFDTNILIYASQPDTAKSQRANELIGAGGNISVQNLNEFANVARRKLKRSSPEIIVSLAALRRALTVLPVTLETHETGLRIFQRYGLSIYDSMVVASALLTDCETLWSEDMQHGMHVEGRLTIRDPFLA